MAPITQSIMVGVTGENENTAALRFALDEARRHGCGITLVHAVHPMLPPPPPSLLITDDTWSEVGSMIVGEARTELARLAGDDSVRIATAVRHGTPGEVFSELSKDARMIVLQHRDLSPLRRLTTTSSVVSVAKHAHCPVVSVPASFVVTELTDLTVGVRHDGGPRAVLDTAFAEASGHRCLLRAVHAWWPVGGDDVALPAEVEWNARDQAELEAGVDRVRGMYPDVDVKVEAYRETPVDALLEAGGHSQLLVVGRHEGLRALPHRLGHVARSLLGHARCPVMIVPV